MGNDSRNKLSKTILWSVLFPKKFLGKFPLRIYLNFSIQDYKQSAKLNGHFSDESEGDA